MQALTLGRASVSVPQPHFKWEDGSHSNSAGTPADDEDQPQAERPPAVDDANEFGHAPTSASKLNWRNSPTTSPVTTRNSGSTSGSTSLPSSLAAVSSPSVSWRVPSSAGSGASAGNRARTINVLKESTSGGDSTPHRTMRKGDGDRNDGSGAESTASRARALRASRRSGAGGESLALVGARTEFDG